MAVVIRAFCKCRLSYHGPFDHYIDFWWLNVTSQVMVSGVPSVHVVSEDGSPHGHKSFIMWNPPLSIPPPKPGQEKERQPRMSHTEGRTRQGNKRCFKISSSLSFLQRGHAYKKTWKFLGLFLMMDSGGRRRLRFGSKCLRHLWWWCLRKQMEWLRSRLQEGEQARGAGIHLGATGAGVWSPSDADWLSAARIGRRRRAVAGSALADASVQPMDHPLSSFVFKKCHVL